MTALAAERLTRRFGHGRRAHTAVDAVDVEFPAGSRTGIVGESGSGKSTLGLMLVGLDRPNGGRVLVDGDDLAPRMRTQAGRRAFRREVQLIAQDTSSSFDPLRTLRDALRTPARQLVGLSIDEADARIAETLGMLGIDPAFADRYPHEVSGGQRQRFAIARALVVRPGFVVCDEVVSALDVSVQGQVLNSLKRYCAQTGAGLAFISHGLPATAFISDRLVVMYRGVVVEQGPTERVIAEPEHPYTRHLLNAHRGPGFEEHRAEVLAGSEPLVPASEPSAGIAREVTR
ncbi:ABC transporter ATP-binding protein [Herbiconiux moechotypicola]|uniref:ATP-binding cassette domain-containing protein n=1 Tax=Herbiconiux moechotypicola TaxID=637393 RepID=A0ABP5QJN0_9MICO|nr:ABC transporter ATP-binding protein [Herbiconiux moechotypicola]MCS5730048.1 ABC transporter ATP-binding protein [Herbiconiux moechotypicola]